MIPLLSTWTILGPITFLKGREGHQFSLVDEALHLKPSYQRSIHPVHRSHLFIVLQLHHSPSTRTPFHRNTQQWAISDNVITEASCWKTPALCFLRTPIFVYPHDSSSIGFHSKDTSWFLSVTSSLSLMSSLFAPISLIHLGSAFWFHSKTDRTTILCFSVSSSLLHPWHLFSCDQLSYNLFCTHPPSTQFFLKTWQCLSVSSTSIFFRNMAWIGSNQTPSFSFSYSCLTVHFLQ